MKILITGANGFVGGNVSRYLMAKGIACVALDIAGAPERGSYCERYTWDDLETLDLAAFDAIIHLAGKAHDTKNTSDPQSYFDINVGLTRRLLSSKVLKFESSKVEEGGTPRQGAAGPRQRIRALKFIFFSSVKACADTVEGVLTEEHPPKPGTPYGQSKLEAERVVRSSLVHYCDSALVGREEVGGRSPEDSAQITNELMNSRTNELSYYILRPAMIHGPGNKGNLNLLVKVVQKGIPWPLAAFENRRSFTSVENVSRVLEALLTGSVEPGIYQVADDEPLSTNQLISMIAESLGRRPKLWRIPRGFMKGVACLGDLLHLPLNSERLKKLTESYVVSNAKLLKALGWAKMPLGAEEGMRATLIATTYCDH